MLNTFIQLQEEDHCMYGRPNENCSLLQQKVLSSTLNHTYRQQVTACMTLQLRQHTSVNPKHQTH
jgi:hypothetical protein